MNCFKVMQGVSMNIPLVDGTAVVVSTVGLNLPSTVSVTLETADISASTAITVSYSRNGGAKYTSLAVVTAAEWEDILESGITHLKFQRTAGTGITGVGGIC